MSPTSKLTTVEIRSRGLRPTLLFKGPISDQTSFPLGDLAETELLTLDLGEVTRISSSGIRLWIQWLNAFRAMYPRAVIVLSRAPRCMIDQLNVVRGFVPAPYYVQSMIIPYVCDACVTSTDLTIERERHYHELNEKPDQVKLPEPNCPKCGEKMEPDINTSIYFRCLNRIKEGIEQFLALS